MLATKIGGRVSLVLLPAVTVATVRTLEGLLFCVWPNMTQQMFAFGKASRTDSALEIALWGLFRPIAYLVAQIFRHRGFLRSSPQGCDTVSLSWENWWWKYSVTTGESGSWMESIQLAWVWWVRGRYNMAAVSVTLHEQLTRLPILGGCWELKKT